MLQMMTKFLLGWNMCTLKDGHVDLQKTIVWTKKSRKGGHEWEHACVKNGMRHQKLKTLVKTRFVRKVTMFKKRQLSFKMPLLFVITRKNLWLYNIKYLKPKCGLLLK